MSHRSLTIVITLLAVVFLAVQPGIAAAQEPPGALQVDIVAADTRRPLTGVLVTVTDRNGETVTATSSADGRVDFENLAPGLYALTAETDGRMMAEEPSVRIVRRKTTPLEIEMQELAEVIGDGALPRARAEVVVDKCPSGAIAIVED